MRVLLVEGGCSPGAWQPPFKEESLPYDRPKPYRKALQAPVFSKCVRRICQCMGKGT